MNNIFGGLKTITLWHISIYSYKTYFGSNPASHQSSLVKMNNILICLFIPWYSVFFQKQFHQILTNREFLFPSSVFQQSKPKEILLFGCRRWMMHSHFSNDEYFENLRGLNECLNKKYFHFLPRKIWTHFHWYYKWSCP